MNQSANTRLIGLFVLGTLALATILILIFGGGHYFSSDQKYAAYFEGSLNGLNVGAQVKLKGANIGRVTEIHVRYDLSRNRVLTPVILQIDFGKVTDIRNGQGSEPHDGKDPGNPDPPDPKHRELKRLIDRGLRARLSHHGLLTGQLYVDLNFLPEEPVHLVNTPDPELSRIPEIPTLPSDFEAVENRLRELPIKETLEATRQSIRRIEQLLSSPEAQASLGNLNRSLDNLQRLTGHVDSKVDGLTQHLEGTVKDSRILLQTLNSRMASLLEATEKTLAATTTTLTRAQGTLSSLEHFADPDSELNRALHSLSGAARSIRTLTDSLERNPEALIYGRKGSR